MGQKLAGLFVIGAGFIIQGLVTISGIVSARLLGVEGRGEVALVIALGGMATQLTLGGSLANSVAVSLADRGVRARDGLRHLVPTWVGLGVAGSVPFGVLFIFLHGDPGATYVWWLGFMVVMMALQGMGFRLVTNALLGESAPMNRVAVATLLPQALSTTTLVILFVAVRESTALVVTVVMATSLAIGLIVSVLLLRPARLPKDDETDRVEGRKLWRMTRSTYVSSIGPIDGLSLDRALIGAMLGTAALGLYAAAIALAALTSTLASGMAAVLLPRIAGAQRDPAAEHRLVVRWLGATALMLAVVGLLVAAIAKPVIEIAFGQEFAAAVPIAYWLIAASALLGYRRILIAVLQGRQRGGSASWIELALTPVVVLGIVVAARMGEPVGAGIAMFAVAVCAVLALGVAVVRTAPSRRVGRHARGVPIAAARDDD
ncbi:lipopolysaccharide biosynthesis protein [Aeromicrobium alkaliterrae]|uniref:Polysaccharide biosynthesis protein n=1 Tax=Aeromicrobium alkaliterrae TaxID=302168 RepID=A0ABN2K357_9ACTN